MVTTLTLFGLQGNLNFDITIASSTITLLSLLFSILHYKNIRGQGNGKGTIPIILWWLTADTMGPYGHPHCLAMFFSCPQGPHATVGSTGGDTVQFLGFESHQSEE